MSKVILNKTFLAIILLSIVIILALFVLLTADRSSRVVDFKLLILSDGELYVRESDKEDIKLTDTNGKVEKFIVSEDKSYIVYSVVDELSKFLPDGIDIKELNVFSGGKIQLTSEVYLLNSKTYESKKVYSQDTLSYDQLSKSITSMPRQRTVINRIYDSAFSILGFSKNSKEFYFHQDGYISKMNIDSLTVEKVFNNTYLAGCTTKLIAEIDEPYMSIVGSCYEGGKSVVINLATKSQINNDGDNSLFYFTGGKIISKLQDNRIFTLNCPSYECTIELFGADNSAKIETIDLKGKISNTYNIKIISVIDDTITLRYVEDDNNFLAQYDLNKRNLKLLKNNVLGDFVEVDSSGKYIFSWSVDGAITMYELRSSEVKEILQLDNKETHLTQLQVI